jgi:hypothetical protein
VYALDEADEADDGTLMLRQFRYAQNLWSQRQLSFPSSFPGRLFVTADYVLVLASPRPRENGRLLRLILIDHETFRVRQYSTEWTQVFPHYFEAKLREKHNRNQSGAYAMRELIMTFDGRYAMTVAGLVAEVFDIFTGEMFSFEHKLAPPGEPYHSTADFFINSHPHILVQWPRSGTCFHLGSMV